jgi:RNA polymerase sigma-70 factor (ECF subfamily)
MSNDQTVRQELCLEAIRLCTMLIENEATNKPQVNALMALMCFHTSRFHARTGPTGALVLYDEQDTGLWNQDLIGKGGYFLQQAAVGNQVSRYHLEAGIAYWHTHKEDTLEKWESIMHYYDRLLKISDSPAIALNRIYALSKAKGKEAAIREAEKLSFTDNHFYYALLGELYRDLDNKKAGESLEKALTLAKTEPERHIVRNRIDGL